MFSSKCPEPRVDKAIYTESLAQDDISAPCPAASYVSQMAWGVRARRMRLSGVIRRDRSKINSLQNGAGVSIGVMDDAQLIGL